ncbi:MAG: Ms4533A family Cys-rich leader peptide [Catenulispora sp.]
MFLGMSSLVTARLAFLERALLAVTDHCVADILCSRSRQTTRFLPSHGVL